jgi:hypothetical protein
VNEKCIDFSSLPSSTFSAHFTHLHTITFIIPRTNNKISLYVISLSSHFFFCQRHQY